MAQIDIINGHNNAALKNLSAAIKIEEDINGWDREDCEQWMNSLK